jgi:leucyl-tRNA synthetase
MDPTNREEYFSKEAISYWQQVDLYIGGAEHATGHLIYSRFWNKFLFDLGMTFTDEPFKKMINQGMIQGKSKLVYRVKGTNQYVSYGLKNQYDTTPIHVDVNIVTNDELDINAFLSWRPDYTDATFILEDGKYFCGSETEKMSKSLHNVVNPDELIERYGADTFRLYEMFLGPLTDSKPWDTNGIEGVFRFIRKLWRLYHNEDNTLILSDEAPKDAELKILHRAIKKVREDIERYSFNTVVSNFMICVNELAEAKCHNRQILKDLAVLIAPFAPHIAEELWAKCGNSPGISDVPYPEFNAELLVENTFSYPVSFNGKLRFKLDLPLSLTAADIEKIITETAEAQKWLEGKPPKKVIFVPGKIINVVI